KIRVKLLGVAAFDSVFFHWRTSSPKRRLLMKSEKDFTVVLYLFAVFLHKLHHASRISPLFKFYDHFQRHKIYGGIFHPVGLSGCLFHFVGTVGAVHINFVGFFHSRLSFLFCVLIYERLFICLLNILYSSGRKSQEKRETLQKDFIASGTPGCTGSKCTLFCNFPSHLWENEGAASSWIS